MSALWPELRPLRCSAQRSVSCELRPIEIPPLSLSPRSSSPLLPTPHSFPVSAPTRHSSPPMRPSAPEHYGSTRDHTHLSPPPSSTQRQPSPRGVFRLAFAVGLQARLKPLFTARPIPPHTHTHPRAPPRWRPTCCGALSASPASTGLQPRPMTVALTPRMLRMGAQWACSGAAGGGGGGRVGRPGRPRG